MGSKISIHDAGPGVSLEEDWISNLPDHLLHHILSFVPAQYAVRTSALSRRWRHVWIGLPTYAFSDADTRSTAGFADSVDKVLVARSHHVDALEISIRHPLHTSRANVWLRRAVERVRGSISIVFPSNDDRSSAAPIVLDLPCGGRAQALSLSFSVAGIGTLRVSPSPASAAVSSSSLTELELKLVRLDGSSFSDFVSSCCPHLKKLHVHTFGDMDYLKLSNDALEDLSLQFVTGGGLRQLQVSSRNLRRLSIANVFSSAVRPNEVHDGSKVASLRAPRLEYLSWPCSSTLHPSRVEFADSLATVRHLDVSLITHASVLHTYWFHNQLAVWLLQHCTGVRCLRVSLWNSAPAPTQVLSILDEAVLAEYDDLMVEVPMLSNVTDLTVTTLLDHHEYGASIAKLLSRCNYVEMLTIVRRENEYYACANATMCWCKSPLDWRRQKLQLQSLRQIYLRSFSTRLAAAGKRLAVADNRLCDSDFVPKERLNRHLLCIPGRTRLASHCE
uniref:Uncharacterized protein n=1 Tax=Avena sativa TaxID=4498 RepID=A0ACD5W0J7_AVESA